MRKADEKSYDSHRLCHIQMCKYIRSLGCQKLPRSKQRKGICSAQRIEQQFCDEKTTNAEIAVFLCRKLLLFGVQCGIMTDSDKMH